MLLSLAISMVGGTCAAEEWLACDHSSASNNAGCTGGARSPLLMGIFADGFDVPTCAGTCFVEPYTADGSLPPSPTSRKVALSSQLQKVDLAFIVDTTGSMEGAINNLKAGLSSTIIPALATRIPDLGIGVMGHDDVPTHNFSGGGACPVSYGSCNNTVFGAGFPNDLISYIPTNGALRDVSAGGVVIGTAQAQAQGAVNALRLAFGNDLPESQIPALLRAIRGDALAWSASCGCPAGSLATDVGGTGTFGALRFRTAALPIVMGISDARSHNGKRPPMGPADAVHFPYVGSASTLPNVDQLLSALNAAGAKFIGGAAADAVTPDTDIAIRNSASDRSAYGDMAYLSDGSGSNVPPSAFPGATCKTGIAGATVLPDGPGNTCRLIFSLRKDGTGLSTSIVDGVAALLNDIKFDILVQAYNDPAETTDVVGNFMLKVEPDPSGGTDPLTGGVCLAFPAALLADLFNGPKALIPGPDGVNDTIRQVNPGPRFCFGITPKANNVVAATATQQTFRAWLRVVVLRPNGGVLVLGQDREVLFVVPPSGN